MTDKTALSNCESECESDKTATERLRELLDERGVKWWEGWDKNLTNFDGTNGVRYQADCTLSNILGKVFIRSILPITPEQAIAATLGDELNPDGLPAGLTISEDGELLNWRGENYVRQSTLGGGECEFVDDSDGEPAPPKCNSCGYDPGIYECAWLDDGTYEYERNYCPSCGRKVKR